LFAMDKELTPIQAKAVEILENRRFWSILAGCALIVLVVGAVRYYSQEGRRREESAASDKLFEVSRVEVEGVQPNPSIFSQDFMKKRVEWSAEKKAKFKTDLEALVAKYPTTSTAQSARIRLAALAYQDAHYAEAQKYFDEAISKGTTELTDIPYWTAKLGKGYAFEAEKKYEDALKVFQDISSNLKNPLAAEALLSQARTLKAMGRSGEIEAIAEKMKTEFAGTYHESALHAYLPAKSGS
jgi:hypothetical protein